MTRCTNWVGNRDAAVTVLTDVILLEQNDDGTLAPLMGFETFAPVNDDPSSNCQPVADWVMSSTSLQAAATVQLDHGVGHEPKPLHWAKNTHNAIAALQREHQSEAFYQET